MFSEILTFVIFLLIGLEIREGFTKPKATVLPALCAAGGMIAPALIFLIFQAGSNIWAVTMPTDVALALGALSLLGNRVNAQTRLFLLMLAVADDLLSLGVIAIFFRSDLDLASVVYTFGAVSIGFIAPKRTIVLKFVAPIATYVAIPLYIVINLLSKLDFTYTTNSVTWSIVIARVIGKIVGITLVAWAILRIKPSLRPNGLSLDEIAGIAALAGMGLTVSLVIANIAVESESALSEVRMGLFFAAVISALFGVGWLKRSLDS